MISPMLPKTKIDSANGVLLKQTMDMGKLIQRIFCCQENHYQIQTVNTENDAADETSPINGDEHSNCLPCRCLFFPMHQLEMKLTDQVNNEGQIISMEKPCRIPLLCLCRPFMKVSNSKEEVGDTTVPCRMCPCSAIVVDVREKTSGDPELKYKVTGSPCQCGVCFPRCCLGCCDKATFEIQDNAANKVGIIQRESVGCWSWFSDAQNFRVMFPKDATFNQRALLISSAYLLDYTYFEGRFWARVQ